MSTKTENYQLNQWAPGDPFLRTDFNEDNAKLDAALAAHDAALAGLAAGKADQAAFTQDQARQDAAIAAHDTALACKCEVVLTSYTGDGGASRTIHLGFRPKAVFISAAGWLSSSFLGLDGYDNSSVQIKDTGFFIQKYNNTIPNTSGLRYDCLILR